MFVCDDVETTFKSDDFLWEYFVESQSQLPQPARVVGFKMDKFARFKVFHSFID